MRGLRKPRGDCYSWS